MANLCPAVGANRDIAFVREEIFKETPASPFFKFLRTTGDSLQGTVETQQSNELRKGRTTSAPVKGRSSSSGDIPVEMSYRSFDEFLAGLMFNYWELNNELTYQDGDKEIPSREAVPGQKRLRLGQIDQSYTIMRHFSDKQLYRFYRGCMINSFSLSVPLDGQVTGTFNILGANNPRVLDTRDAADELVINSMGISFDPETPHSTDQFNSFIGTLKSIHLVDGSGTEIGEDIGYATQLDLTVAHDLDQDYAIFEEDAICVSPQRFNVTGTVTLYLLDGKHINHVIDWDTLKIVFVIEDPKGNMYQFRMEEVKLTDAPDGVSGPESITVAYPFTAFGERSLDIIAIPSEEENRVLAPLIEIAGDEMTLVAHPDYADVANANLYPDGVPSTYVMEYRIDGSDTWLEYSVPVTLDEGLRIIEVRAIDSDVAGYAPSVSYREERIISSDPYWKYVVTFDVNTNGGEWLVDGQDIETDDLLLEVEYPDTTIASLGDYVVQKSGETFKEWNTEDTGDGDTFELGTTEVDTNIKVFAIFE